MLAELAPAAPAAPAVYSLPAIPTLRLRCTLRALAPAVLPPFQGSLLRGAFGHALRRTACAMGPAQPCASCRLRSACVYTRLFETFVEGEPPPFLRGLPTSPRPYVFEPGTGARSFAPGEELPFDLLLFGRAVDLEAYAVLAVERMAAAGLGRARVPFALDRIEAEECAPALGLPGAGSAGSAVTAASRCTSPPALTRGVLRFVTPTRIKVRGRLVGEVSFRTLAFAMLRRIHEIAHFHVPGAAPDWSFQPLLRQADGVKVVASDLRWVDWERYSNRQKTRMRLGGFTGSMELAGDLAPFEPLLRAAEVLHVGKGATFGLGKMVAEFPGAG
jgi:hypothetical protein